MDITCFVGLVLELYNNSLPALSMQPHNGEKVYALSGINWGVFKDAEENRNRSLPGEVVSTWSVFSTWGHC